MYFRAPVSKFSYCLNLFIFCKTFVFIRSIFQKLYLNGKTKKPCVSEARRVGGFHDCNSRQQKAQKKFNNSTSEKRRYIPVYTITISIVIKL